MACGGPQAPGSAASTAAPAAANGLQAALSGPARTAAEKARDVHRHPAQTLEFFGLREDMGVLEVSPGGGWYTAILAPYLAAKGHLSVTNFDPEGPADSPLTNFGKKLRARLDADKATFGKVTVHTQPAQGGWNLGPDASYDMILTFRNIHNWLPDGDKAFFAAAFKALKPGGTLGVVEHRAKPGTDVPTSQKTGYVDEAYVVSRAQAAGFRLLAKSEINANPKDTKDHPEGVWTLPPVLRLGDKDRGTYEAIGESDRMTLKFVKP